jgi:2-amino-4-hydroxy-6-hydroxymethyldihydropteridine diphosphokinase
MTEQLSPQHPIQHPQTAYIGLGSNLDQPIEHILSALRKLKVISCGTFIYSSLYQSSPLDKTLQPDYINAVACIETHLPPVALLKALQQIEQEQGRIRDIRWGARTLDLDLLLVDHLYIQTECLSLPHPGLTQRDFVLKPLVEISPNMMLPNGQYAKDLLPYVQDNALICLGRFTL